MNNELNTSNDMHDGNNKPISLAKSENLNETAESISTPSADTHQEGETIINEHESDYEHSSDNFHQSTSGSDDFLESDNDDEFKLEDELNEIFDNSLNDILDILNSAQEECEKIAAKIDEVIDTSDDDTLAKVLGAGLMIYSGIKLVDKILATDE